MISALLTCHNRRERTLACLRSLVAAAERGPDRLEIIVVDDGSTDGTKEAVQREFPKVKVIEGSGQLFWAGGMRLAEEAALDGGAEYFLWLNDDVELAVEALEVLTGVAETNGRPVVVGAVCDPDTGVVTYSGVRRIGRHPLHFELVDPASHGQMLTGVDAFNGNVVLVPRVVSEQIGGIDAGLVHRGADFDFALRARAIGVPIHVTSTFVGTCRRDCGSAPWFDRTLTRRERIRLLLGPKGVPMRPSLRYLRRHAKLTWPALWALPYIRFAASLTPGLGRFVPGPRLGPLRSSERSRAST